MELIPYEDFGGKGALLHFAHANGYPPGAYQPLFEYLAPYFRIFAMHMRPLWPNSNPESISDWRPLTADLRRFLDQVSEKVVIGAGHSMGATISLQLAIQQPRRFQALILMDPVIFPPSMSRLWNLAAALHLDYKLHPLVTGARKRRAVFEDLPTLFANYRAKPVFRRICSEHLMHYAAAACTPLPDGRLSLRYPPAWEARIYVTGLKADLETWKNLGQIRIPIFILRGEDTDTFRLKTASLIQKRLPHAEIHTIPDASHLVPLERPKQVADRILEFLAQHHLLASMDQPENIIEAN